MPQIANQNENLEQFLAANPQPRLRGLKNQSLGRGPGGAACQEDWAVSPTKATKPS
jgi:hypothetical protein